MKIITQSLLEHTCGYAITEQWGHPPTFYDTAHPDAAITVCPGCGNILHHDDLQMSEAGRRALANVYQYLLGLRRKP